MERRIRLEDLRVTRHVRDRIRQRLFTEQMLAEAVEYPEVTYAAGPRYPNQVRHIVGDMCVTIDLKNMSIPTAFYNGRLDPNWKA